MGKVELFKTWDDGTAEYKLSGGGIEVGIYSRGGIIQSIHVPDNTGNTADVTLGHDTPQEYKSFYLGALIGRFANRISGAKFNLDGVDYQLAVNNGPNHLHGGLVGFDKKHWKHSIDGTRLVLSYTSDDGEESYPGKLEVQVTYEVTDQSELIIDYQASTDKPTILNLTNHAYFNLEGHDKGNIYGHKVKLASNEYTPVDSTSIPTGEIASVQGTVFDLREETAMAPEQLAKVDGKGYDHNFLVPGNQGSKRLVGRVSAGGRVMETYTTQPGVQFYTGYYIKGGVGKGGAKYEQYSGLCLETQKYPDAPNKANFPSPVLRPGEKYHHTTWYKFSTE